MSIGDLVDGQCFCGEIQFDLELPVFGIIYCHCNMCRQTSGADYSTWVRVLTNNFKITKGDDKLTEFIITDKTSSYFCKKCSSVIYTSDKDYSDSVGVLRGMIRGDVGQLPLKHFFYDHRAPWVDVQDGLPKFGGDSGFEPRE
jgi:hypothetical protein